MPGREHINRGGKDAKRRKGHRDNNRRDPGAKFVKIGEHHYEIQTEGDTLEFDNLEVGEITFGAIKSIAKAFEQKEEIANADHN